MGAARQTTRRTPNRHPGYFLSGRCTKKVNAVTVRSRPHGQQTTSGWGVGLRLCGAVGANVMTFLDRVWLPGTLERRTRWFQGEGLGMDRSTLPTESSCESNGSRWGC